MVELAYSVKVLDCESREQGSIPDFTQNASVAQLVVQLPCKHQVVSSSLTISSIIADVMELVDMGGLDPSA